MAIGRVRHRQNKYTSKVSSNTDTYMNINLESEIKLLPPGQLTEIVNLGDVFNEEREVSTRYRIVGTLLPVFSNVLFNLSGNKGPNQFGDVNGITNDKTYGFQTFDGYTFKIDPYDNQFNGQPDLTYEQSLNKHLKEVNGWFGFYDPDFTKLGTCKFYDLEPKRSRFDLNSSLTFRNWELTITYPYSNNTDHYLVNGGLLITTSGVRTLGGKPMVVLGSVAPHNLSVGDTVRITDMSNQNMNGDFVVQSLGLTNGDSKSTFFVIDIDPTLATTGNLFTTGRMKRLYYGNEVTYYFRKFKKIKGFESQESLTINDYEAYPLAFSRNIYNDQNYQIVFNDDIDISDLKDNLGRPLSEIYLTMIKTKSNNIFTRVQSGFDLENQLGNVTTTTIDGRKVSNIRKIHTSNLPLAPFESHTPLENDVLVNNIDFYGDICEYSKYEVKETILLDVMHRFNTIDREITTVKSITNGTINGPRNEGYIYKPHYKIKIRDYSNYVEQGDTTTVGIPEYSEYLGDGRYLWRDLLPLGVNDGQEETLDYPFLNDSHYIHQLFCIVTKRQDPFGNFGLLYRTDFPRDIIGDALGDNFTIKNSNDVC